MESMLLGMSLYTRSGSDVPDPQCNYKTPALFFSKRYCQSAEAGIYSAPHLPPPSKKVSQVEMEASDCEGRLPPLFQWAVSCEQWVVRQVTGCVHPNPNCCLLLTAHCILLTDL